MILQKNPTRESSKFPGDAPLLTIVTLGGDATGVKILLEAGAQVDATDNECQTALVHAILQNHLDIFKVYVIIIHFQIL